MKKYAANLLLWVAAASFGFGLFELFKLRFEAGDVYPPYSSLRSDPLGTMAIFESLARMPSLEMKRDFSSANQLPAGPGCTYLHLAATREEWLSLPEEGAKEIQRYILEGGRLVIAFVPQTSRSSPRTAPPAPAGKPPAKPVKSGAISSSSSSLFKDRWGVEFGFKALRAGDGGAYNPVRVENRSELALPDGLDWHSAMIFTNVNAGWHTVYARGANPVVLERKFGAGSVVLMTDCYCLSNEAMVSDRHPDLLAWLVGTAKTVQFDEAHLGLTESPGVSVLIRQYRLHGLIAALLLVAGLFIWQHSASFLPRFNDAQPEDEIAGKEAAAGMVSLLRRNIASREVLQVCFNEWTKSLAKRGTYSLARVDEAQALFEAEAKRPKADQDPLRAYRQIRLALKGSDRRAQQAKK
jgi:hypothetical protein